MIPSSYHTALNLSLSHSLNEIIDSLSALCVPMAIPVCRHIFSQLRTKLARTGIWTTGPTDNWSQTIGTRPLVPLPWTIGTTAMDDWSQTIGTTAMDDWYHCHGRLVPDHWYHCHGRLVPDHWYHCHGRLVPLPWTIGPRPLVPLPWTIGRPTMCLDDRSHPMDYWYLALTM